MNLPFLDCQRWSCALARRRAVAVAQHTPGRGGVFDELAGRAHGPARKFTAAIRAGSGKHALSAIGAERALEGADHRLARLRRQILVAAFAVRPEVQHPKPSTVSAR